MIIRGVFNSLAYFGGYYLIYFFGYETTSDESRNSLVAAQ